MNPPDLFDALWRFTPILSLGSGRLHAVRVQPAQAAPAALDGDAFGALLRTCPPPTRLALPAALLPAATGGVAPPAGLTVVLACTAVQAGQEALAIAAAARREAGLRTALAGFDGGRDALVAALMHAFDEVWLAPRLTAALATRASWARGLLTDLVQVLGRRGVQIVAGGVEDRRQLDAAARLGLAAVYGPLIGEDWTPAHWAQLRAGGYPAD